MGLGRRSWNDQRVDELAERTAENAREVRGEIHDLRTEIREVEESLRGDTDKRFAKLEGKSERHLDMVMGALITAFIGLIVTHFIG